jgi:ribosome maturation factor RimP
MGNSDAIALKVEEITRRVGASEGIEVVEVEWKGTGNNRFLRIYIDKPEGVTHTDCEMVSEQVGTILDVEELIPWHYTLEVSSPGVERKLAKLQDYERFRGKKAKVVLHQPVDNQRLWEGTLAGFEADEVLMSVASGRQIRVPFDRIKKANLKFEW